MNLTSSFTSVCWTLLLCGLSCQSGGSEYLNREAKELASGARYDSLFFGIYLGMPSKDFYTHCWKLNKKGLIRQGATNTSVYYKVEDFEHPCGMDFYPEFYQDSIIRMPITFSYDAWAPWNRHLYADSLKVDVIALMEKWYGTGFIEIESPNELVGNAFVKIDGNRRISIYNLNDQKVNVDIVDLKKFKAVEDKLPAKSKL